MAFINLQPSNLVSERFVLGGRLDFRTQDTNINMNDNLNNFLPLSREHRGVLRKYTSYQLSVTPYNKQGVGPSSSSVVATTMEDGKDYLYRHILRKRITLR